MRKVIYTDRLGFKRAALVRDTDPDDAAASGLPLGPPDFNLLDMEEVKRDINNFLVEQGVFNIKDLPRHPNAITQAVRSALVGRIVVLYKQQEANDG
jgi:hypothetical protein